MREYAIAAIPADGIFSPESRSVSLGLGRLQATRRDDAERRAGTLAPVQRNYFGAIGAPASAKLRDLLDHKALGTAQNSYSAEVPTHGTALVKVSK